MKENPVDSVPDQAPAIAGQEAPLANTQPTEEQIKQHSIFLGDCVAALAGAGLQADINTLNVLLSVVDRVRVTNSELTVKELANYRRILEKSGVAEK